MAKWQRDKSKERFWRRMLQRWRRSQLTVRDFCAQLGLAEHNFFAWQRVIAERDQEAAASGPASTTTSWPTRGQKKAPQFLPRRVPLGQLRPVCKRGASAHFARARRGQSP